MKIYIPILAFGRSGGFRVISQLANYIKSENTEVIFLCFSKNDIFSIPYYPTTSRIIYIDYKGREILKEEENSEVFGYENNSTILNRIRQIIAIKRAINRFTNSEDIILATYSLTAFSVFYSKPNNKKFYYIQAYEPELFKNDLINKIKSLMISKTYNLKLNRIVNSPIYFNYKNLTSNKCVYPGLDSNIFNSNGRSNGNQTIVIGCIGRREESKGIRYVIDAFNILKIKGINCIFKMAVFGNNNMLTDQIIPVQPKNDLELANFYKEIDVLIAPGIIQFGAVHYPVIEAMACGTSVITTCYHPAHPDNAWIVEPNNSLDIANKIEEIILNPEQVKSKALRAEGDILHLEWSKVAKHMKEILESA